MDPFFGGVFGILVVLCVVLRYKLHEAGSKKEIDPTISESFGSFQKNYLLVYFIVMGKDEFENLINALRR